MFGVGLVFGAAGALIGAGIGAMISHYGPFEAVDLGGPAPRSSVLGTVLKGVSVEGVVTSGGSPLYQARVDLSWGGESWTVRTDRNGRYQIHGLGEPDRCSDLHLTILHPDQRTTDPLPVKCGEQQLDFDFPAPTTS